MWRYVTTRLLAVIPVMFGVAVLAFLMLVLTPGDPALLMLGERATEEQLQTLRQEMGLDKPAYVQFARFMANLVRGDLGRSIRSSRPVAEELLARLPATVELAVAAVVLSVLLGIPLGVISAVRRGSLADHLAMLFALGGVAMPAFWQGLMLMLIFAVYLGWLPPSGRMGGLEYLVLPAITLGTRESALIARMTRSSLLEVIRQDYIRTARAKGLSERVVIFRHALRNALLSVVTVVGLNFGSLLAGVVVTETVFSWPGIGRFMVDAIRAKDFPVVQGAVVMFGFLAAAVNLLVDLLYAVIDPRIRAQYVQGR
ncbi:MAG: ABC transporter permease [Firmicutes bacterium]|nr:ABC transporter permease [Bacillota bacterium]